MIKNNVKMALVLMLAMVSTMSYGQSRKTIRDAIQRWGECKSVAITKTNGDVALYGNNGYQTASVPTGLLDELKRLNNEKKTIQDVQLTENGNYTILYGDNGCTWKGIPSSLEKKIREYNRNEETITSITFNDSGEWIIISDKHFASSHTYLQEWLNDGHDSYGVLWAACITSDGACVAVYEEGYKYRGNVPEDLKTALRNTSLDVYRVKIAGSSWFFADKSGSYKYNM